MRKLETQTDRQTDICTDAKVLETVSVVFSAANSVSRTTFAMMKHMSTHTQTHKVKTLPANADMFGKYVTLDLRLPWCELIQPLKTAYMNHQAQNCMLTVFTLSCYWVN